MNCSDCFAYSWLYRSATVTATQCCPKNTEYLLVDTILSRTAYRQFVQEFGTPTRKTAKSDSVTWSEAAPSYGRQQRAIGTRDRKQRRRAEDSKERFGRVIGGSAVVRKTVRIYSVTLFISPQVNTERGLLYCHSTLFSIHQVYERM